MVEKNENKIIYNSFSVLYDDIFLISNDDLLKYKWDYMIKSLKYKIIQTFHKTKGFLLRETLISEFLRINYISELTQNFDTTINEIVNEYEEINLIISKIDNHVTLWSFESVYNNIIWNLDQQNRFDFDNKFVQLNKAVSDCHLHWLKQNLIYSKNNFDEQYNHYKNNSISKIDFILWWYLSFKRRLIDVNKKIISIKFIFFELQKMGLQMKNNQ